MKKQTLWFLLGASAILGIAAVAPQGGGSSGVPVSNGSATNLSVYSSGTTNQPLRVFGGTQTNSNPVDILLTWNAAGITFTGMRVLVTNTAAASDSIIASFGATDMAGGSVPLRVFDKYTRFGSYGAGLSYDARIENVLGGTSLVGYDSGSRAVFMDYTGLNLGASYPLRWWSGAAGAGSVDTALRRSASGLMSIDSGTAGVLRDFASRSIYATNLYATNITAQGYLTTQQTLAYASGTNVTVDASKSLHFVTLTNTSYFAQPSSLAVGSSFTVILKQDGTGGRAVTFDTNYWKFPGGVQPSITTNANAYSVLSCIADPYGTNVFSVSTLDIK